MHLSLRLFGPQGERVVHGGEPQPRFGKRYDPGFTFWVVSSRRDLKKDYGVGSAVYHGVCCSSRRSTLFLIRQLAIPPGNSQKPFAIFGGLRLLGATLEIGSRFLGVRVHGQTG